VALGYLLITLCVASLGEPRVAVSTSIAATLCFNFFFLPPVGTFTIADAHNWIALVTFLIVSVVASRLSATARLGAGGARAAQRADAPVRPDARHPAHHRAPRRASSDRARHVARRFELGRRGDLRAADRR
jgi:K+-sensing histidine kinase KdpD